MTIRTTSMSLVVMLFASAIIYGQNASSGKIDVLSYDTDRKVEAIEAYGAFATGKELLELQRLIGVPDQTISEEEKISDDELFFLLRVKATGKSNGVPVLVKLQLANTSSLLKNLKLIEFGPVFPRELQLKIVKIYSLGQPRDGSIPGMSSGGEIAIGEDLVEKLRNEKPVLRLRGMVTK